MFTGVIFTVFFVLLLFSSSLISKNRWNKEILTAVGLVGFVICYQALELSQENAMLILLALSSMVIGIFTQHRGSYLWALVPLILFSDSFSSLLIINFIFLVFHRGVSRLVLNLLIPTVFLPLLGWIPELSFVSEVLTVGLLCLVYLIVLFECTKGKRDYSLPTIMGLLSCKVLVLTQLIVYFPAILLLLCVPILFVRKPSKELLLIATRSLVMVTFFMGYLPVLLSLLLYFLIESMWFCTEETTIKFTTIIDGLPLRIFVLIVTLLLGALVLRGSPLTLLFFFGISSVFIAKVIRYMFQDRSVHILDIAQLALVLIAGGIHWK